MKPFYTTIKKYLFFSGAITAAAMLFILQPTVKQRVSDAVSLCCGTLIPSLFPALAVTSFLSRTGIPAPIQKVIFFPLRLLTGAPDAAAVCFLLGQTAGYPSGVKSAVALYRQGVLSKEQAGTAALINVNPGLPFSVLVVGKTFAGNALTGLTLYFSAVSANLLLSLFFRRSFQKGKPHKTADTEPKELSDLLIGAVEDACASTIGICAWITAFTAFTAPVVRFPFLAPLNVLLETTNGAAACVSYGNYPLCAFSMSFGGMCLLFQLLPNLKEMGIPAYRFLFCRMICGAIAFAAQTVLLQLFPGAVPAATLQRPVFRASGGSLLSAAALLAMCAVFMLSLIHEKPVYKNAVISCVKQNSMLK